VRVNLQENVYESALSSDTSGKVEISHVIALLVKTESSSFFLGEIPLLLYKALT